MASFSLSDKGYSLMIVENRKGYFNEDKIAELNKKSHPAKF